MNVFRKQKTFSYFLKVDNSQQRKVCLNFFQSIRGLRIWCVRNWILNLRPTRNRREHEISSRKADMKFYVVEFSNPLSRSPSHYFRASSSQLYSQPLFQSFADVYNLYLTKSKESNRRPLSRQVLKNISDGLNLALLHRRKSSSSSAFDWLHQVFSPVDVTNWTVANINPMFVSDTTAVTQTSSRNGQTVLRAPNLLTKEL